MTSPPASVARPVSVTGEANGEWVVVDANGVVLCRAPDEMWAYASAACFNAFPPPPTSESDYNAGVRAAAHPNLDGLEAWLDEFRPVTDSESNLAHHLRDVIAYARVLLRPATESAPNAEAMRRVLGVARTHLAAHQYEYAPGFCNACIPVLADIDAALALPREDGETKPMRQLSQDDIDMFDDALRASSELLYSVPIDIPSIPTSELAKRLREQATQHKNVARILGGTTGMGRDVHEASAAVMLEAASALDAAREGEEEDG